MLDTSLITRKDFDAVAVDHTLSDSTASPELVAAFSKKAVPIRCRENEVLFRTGEPGMSVYLVRSGEVGLMLPLTSTGCVGFHAKTGSLVGLPAAFSQEPYSMTAIAWEGSEVAAMGRDRFCDLVASNPALSLDVLRILAAETRAARIAIVQARGKSLRT